MYFYALLSGLKTEKIENDKKHQFKNKANVMNKSTGSLLHDHRLMKKDIVVFLVRAAASKFNLLSLYLPVKAYQSAEVLQRGMVEIA